MERCDVMKGVPRRERIGDASADRLFGHEGAKMYASDVAPRGGCSETSSMLFSLVLLSCGLPSD